MTPTEAIAVLKNDSIFEGDPKEFVEILRRAQRNHYLPGLVDAVCDLAIHAIELERKDRPCDDS